MNDEDLEIELAKENAPGEQPMSRLRPDQPVEVVGKVGTVPAGLSVFVHLDTMASILSALPSDKPIEAGGLLIGYNCVDVQGKYLLITDAIPATLAEGQRLCLTFTHQAWDQMLTHKHREFPGELIVGWYHTHPGLGVFLSGPDLFIHQHFFSDPMQVALVIDPAQFTWGLFYWRNEELVAATTYYIYGQADNTYEALDRLLGEYTANWEIAGRLHE